VNAAEMFARRHLRVFRLRPFDQATTEGRASERHRRVALTAAAAALAKVLSVGAALVSVPLTLNYLGVERFGMWMTISSLIAMLTFADFGIANGVLSSVANAHGRDDSTAIRRFVASGFFLLAALAAVLMVAFALAYPFVPWHKLFNVQTSLARTEAGPALAVFVACFALAIPLGVVQRVQMGLQQGFSASLWQCLGSVLALAGVLLVIYAQGGLPWLVLALAGAPLLATAANSLHFYFFARPDLRPRLSVANWASARQVAVTGALFFVLQITVAVAYSSDSIVIAQMLGASAVTQYAVPEKLFGLISLALAMVLAPLWPAYGEALARGDGVWVRRTLKRSVMLSFSIAVAMSAIVVFVAPLLIRLWVGDAVTVSLGLLLALSAWKSVEAAGIAVAFFLNGANVIRLQVAVAVSVAITSISLKIYLVPLMGIAGVVWATVAAYLLFAALPYFLLVPGIARRRAGTDSY